jgi:hypothetical protein
MSPTRNLYPEPVRCRRCHQDLKPGEAVELVSLRTGELSFVHRPGLGPGYAGLSCFRATTKSAAVEAIRTPEVRP